MELLHIKMNIYIICVVFGELARVDFSHILQDYLSGSAIILQLLQCNDTAQKYIENP